MVWTFLPRHRRWTKSSCFKVGTSLDHCEIFAMGQEPLDVASNPIDKCEIGIGLVLVEAHCQEFASIKLSLGWTAFCSKKLGKSDSRPFPIQRLGWLFNPKTLWGPSRRHISVYFALNQCLAMLLYFLRKRGKSPMLAEYSNSFANFLIRQLT